MKKRKFVLGFIADGVIFIIFTILFFIITASAAYGQRTYGTAIILGCVSLIIPILYYRNDHFGNRSNALAGPMGTTSYYGMILMLSMMLIAGSIYFIRHFSQLHNGI